MQYVVFLEKVIAYKKVVISSSQVLESTLESGKNSATFTSLWKIGIAAPLHTGGNQKKRHLYTLVELRNCDIFTHWRKSEKAAPLHTGGTQK
jgi:hypothetical protein